MAVRNLFVIVVVIRAAVIVVVAVVIGVALPGRRYAQGEHIRTAASASSLLCFVAVVVVIVVLLVVVVLVLWPLTLLFPSHVLTEGTRVSQRVVFIVSPILKSAFHCESQRVGLECVPKSGSY
ncbi:unnamed protein product [Polarella glacialis]|uniref:Uncharacterized protein n=1 Tax=Polarella glacialis TaxID=89957 RepID=A0A813FQ65_POLGL|nr:unnamed protein product [Polarella glacialis]